MERNALNLNAAQPAAPLVTSSSLKKRRPKPYTKANLKRLFKEPPETELYNNKLYKHVIKWILSEAYRGYSVKNVMDNLLRDGCDSGMVSHLIYYWDTKRFYISYMDEIHDLMDDLEDSLGEPLQAKGNRANWYAWFGFEEMARKISDFLEQDAEQEEKTEE